ncbi:MAG: 5-formyltetrahydrofolate cyclo-ligase [Bacteroidaceae bacterium]
MPSKKGLRNLVRERKAAHSSAELHAMSEEICRGVCRLALWREAKSILLYHALPDEVDVSGLLYQAHRQGKKTYLPVVTGPESIEVRRWEPETVMQIGAFGISEPQGAGICPKEYREIDLAIIPGMAFDDQGHRLGRGKGYYDRLLTRLPQAHRWGICFDFQFLNNIPYEPHDISMEKVIWGGMPQEKD